MKEEMFHKNRIAFIILGNDILYLKNSPMSHKEWCNSLGISDNEYNVMVRGYIHNNQIVYYYGDFKYDERVINVACDTFERIALENNLEDYTVYCGVLKGKVGDIWKPILKIK